MGRIVDVFIYIASALGVFASVFLAIVEAISFPDPLSGFAGTLARVMVYALLPVGIAYVVRLQVIEYDKTPRQVENEGISGCPRWMHVSSNVSIVVGVILFFLPMFLELLHYLPASEGEFLPATSSAGIGLVAYPAFIARLYSANALSNARKGQ